MFLPIPVREDGEELGRDIGRRCCGGEGRQGFEEEEEGLARGDHRRQFSSHHNIREFSTSRFRCMKFPLY